MPDPDVVAIEGVPGVGKSSATMALAEQHGALVASLPDTFRRFRQGSELDTATEPVTRLLYYLAATSHMADFVDLTQFVVFDRWLPSVLGLVESTSHLRHATIAEIAHPMIDRLPHPRLTVMLTAEPAVLRRRMASRSKPPLHTGVVHDLADSSPEFLLRWQQAIAHWCAWLGDHRVVDTTNMTRDAVVDEVAALLRLPRPAADL